MSSVAFNPSNQNEVEKLREAWKSLNDLLNLPMYLLEAKTGRDFPPGITHPEYYYGFIGVTVAWQILFITLSKDPIRYRLMMIPAILEKVSFGVAIIVLFWQERVSIFILAAALVDLCLGVLFVMSYLKTSKGQSAG